MEYLNQEGLKHLVEKIGNAVRDGKWLPVMGGVDDGKIKEGAVRHGEDTKAIGPYSHAEGNNTTAEGDWAHAEGQETYVIGYYGHAEGQETKSNGDGSHAEGYKTVADTFCTHAEGYGTIVGSSFAHAEGIYNYDVQNAFIFTRGVGDGSKRQNAVATYVKYKRGLDGWEVADVTDPKNGYTYLLGVGGYKGQEIDDAKSIQEVIADLETSINDVQAMTDEEIDNIIGE